ncbi:hypothetical protein IWX49DRAFT_326103 [Phyllosticta citricarpa]
MRVRNWRVERSVCVVDLVVVWPPIYSASTLPLPPCRVPLTSIVCFPKRQTATKATTYHVCGSAALLLLSSPPHPNHGV